MSRYPVCLLTPPDGEVRSILRWESRSENVARAGSGLVDSQDLLKIKVFGACTPGKRLNNTGERFADESYDRN